MLALVKSLDMGGYDMKAAVINRFGGPEVFELIDIPTPKPGPDDVLIKVLAATVNRLDHYIRGGSVNPNLSFPHVLGMDAVGEIVEIGSDVRGFSIGDRIIAMPGYPTAAEDIHIRPATAAPSYSLPGLHFSGTYAQYIVIPAAWVVHDHSGLPPEQAVSLPVTLLTAVRAVQIVGEVKTGQTILTHAGASSTGLMSIQVAKALGAKVATTVRTKESAEVVRTIGVDRLINTKEEDFNEAIQDWTQGRGVDVAIDSLGGDIFARTIDAVKPFGIIVAMGFMAGTEVKFDIRNFFFGQKQIRGALMADIEDLQQWLIKVREGLVVPVVDTVLPLSEAAKAHELVAENKAKGAVILMP